MKSYCIKKTTSDKELEDKLKQLHHRLFQDIRKINKTVTIQVTEGDRKHRSMSQNNLSHKWYRDIARFLGDVTPEEVKIECKRKFGLPILRATSQSFNEACESSIDGLGHEALKKLLEYFDVTSLMSVSEMSEYLEDVYHFYNFQGASLEWPHIE